MTRTTHRQIGIAAILFAAFLTLAGIPYGVTAPDNIRNIVLSPLFWPYALAGLLALGGAGLLLASRGLPSAAEAEAPGTGWRPGAGLRLAIAAVIMVLLVAFAETVGLVWAAMPAFLAFAFLVRTRHPVAATIAAIAAPLALYAFFAHVAGVAIPQGIFVRLP
ncbi:hypothetical protein LNKW23_40740 [Paralimibaculum aggregatum]|uniref:DUF1468 domain-containing protein n=1 Tax=Paralimibaculum aggregatum TaxID=3036245 RepID=A0ABQ6LNX5_9RHOB|nr:tripartite tricarboxylate transporter TctB family protein [Limibaculum sp. NKW23]GMG84858.1 hypothetical protein LNKW23_40740 [Limibaculum sp. NKW23]